MSGTIYGTQIILKNVHNITDVYIKSAVYFQK